MRFIHLFIILILSFGEINSSKLIIQNTSQNRTNFEVRIRHFYSGEGEVITWNINEKSLQIIYDCDFENCKEKILYSTAIDSTEAKLYFDKIKAMQLTKLNERYEEEELNDGRKENISIKDVYNKDVNIFIHGKKVKLINEFYKLTDSLLLTKTDFKINR